MILWLNPFAGLSGDMFLAALLDLGAPLDEIRNSVASTGLEGWTLEAARVDAGGLVAMRAEVAVTDTATERRAGELLAYVRRATPGNVAELAAAAVSQLASVEGRLHGQAPDSVHLHELGGLDTIVDIVGTAAALHFLGITQVYSSPIGIGAGGTVTSRHGVLPVPAPATMALLRGAEIAGAGFSAESLTPTGATLLKAAGTRYGPLPPLRVEATGYGAGSRTLPDRPNVLPALLGTPVGTVGHQVLLETNVDDVTGEVLGHLVGAALAAGAADAWITPIVMKKTRPGHEIHILCALERADALQVLLLSETGSLGLRRTIVEKTALHRTITVVQVQGHTVRIKHGPWGAKPEHDDLVAAAAALGVPLRKAALLAMSQLGPPAGGPPEGGPPAGL